MEEKISKSKKKKSHIFNTTRLIALGFLAVILLGSLVLYLPISAAPGQTTSYIDALFTATTSVCVTGLVTVATYSHWSLFGLVVIIILIQIGGLGVVACSTILMVALRRKITMKDRVLIQNAYNTDNLRGLVVLMKRIVKGTFFVEGIGAISFAFQFVPEFGLVKGIGVSIFHSISSFCNSGMDLIGEVSLVPYVGNPIVNFTTMGLIVVGGIGFGVWWDILHVTKEAFEKRRFRGHLFDKLTLNSKLAISTTAVLLIVGAVLIFIFEYNNPNSIGELPLGHKVLASMFQSVTTRTAGAATVLQQNLTDDSALLSIILMFIGGSPAGTAGGIKTTTFALLFFTTYAVLKGKKDTEIFNRKVSSDNVRTGIAVIVLGATTLLVGTMLVSNIEEFPLLDVLYDTTSAFATVGLTRGITPFLQPSSKFILIVMMFIGRIGPITMATAFTAKRHSVGNMRELPEKRVLVG
ncbi:MAG: potassium transporter KtrB [Clostridiales bacterium]|nr:potassium transporter KtrB [Clostridiales bacterium]